MPMAIQLNVRSVTEVLKSFDFVHYSRKGKKLRFRYCGTRKEWELITSNIMCLSGVGVGVGNALLLEYSPNSQGGYLLVFMLSMENLHVGSV